MEHSPRRLSSLGQFYPECVSDNKSGIWHLLHQSVHRAEEIICPQPHRVNRAAFVVDNFNRFCCKPKSALPIHRGDSGCEILDIILGMDDPEGDSDSSNQMGFFCGSPPVRTSNPLIHDALFVKQTVSMSSSLGNSHGGKPPPARVERGSPSCGSPFGGKPKVRIEGFPSGNSKSHCVVPALA